MPQLNRVPGVRLLGDFATRDEVSRRSQLLWAVGVIVVVVVLVVVLTVLFLRPPGRSEYRAVMSETGGITTSTEVRVGGIPVGKVLKVQLGDDQVDVTFSVENSVFVGDQSSLQVRMLTIVGGTYLAVLPSGRERLTDPIPATRTSVPYSTAEVLDSAAGVVQGFDANRLRQTAVTTTNYLNAAPGAIRGILDSVESLTDLVNRQQTQITDLARLGNEYSRAAVDQRDLLVEMINRIADVIPILIGYKDRGLTTYAALETIVRSVGQILGAPYQTRVRPPLLQIFAAADQAKRISDRMDTSITTLQAIADQLSRIVTPGGIRVGQDTASPSYCIPIAGRTC